MPNVSDERQKQNQILRDLCNLKPDGPHCWIQWKGTNVCMDVYCKCGYHGHIDDDFVYHIKCPKCGQVYKVDGHVRLHPLDFEPENTYIMDTDFDEDSK